MGFGFFFTGLAPLIERCVVGGAVPLRPDDLPSVDGRVSVADVFSDAVGEGTGEVVGGLPAALRVALRDVVVAAPSASTGGRHTQSASPPAASPSGTGRNDGDTTLPGLRWTMATEAAVRRPWGIRLHVFIFRCCWAAFARSMVAVSFRLVSLLGQVWFLDTILAFVGKGKTADTSPISATTAATWPEVSKYFVALGLAVLTVTQALCHHHTFMAGWTAGVRAKAVLSALVLLKAMSNDRAAASAPSAPNGAKAKRAIRELSTAAAASSATRTTTDAPRDASHLDSYSDAGLLLNLITADSATTLDHFHMMPFAIMSLLELGLTTVWLYAVIGNAALVALGVCLMIVLPLQVLFGQLVGRFRSVAMHECDIRMRKLTQFISNLRVVKMYGWESYIDQNVTETRERETTAVLKSNSAKMLNLSLFFLSPCVLLLAVFATWSSYATVAATAKLDARRTFVAMALLNMLTRTSTFVPRSTAAMSSYIVAMRKIEAFLNADLSIGAVVPAVEVAEADRAAVQRSDPAAASGGGLADSLPVIGANTTGAAPPTATVATVKGSFLWAPFLPATSGGPSAATTASTNTPHDVHRFSLASVDLNIHAGEIVALVGSVGAGKSALLHALMGRMCSAVAATTSEAAVSGATAGNVASPAVTYRAMGKATTSGGDDWLVVPYVAQQPFILDGTVRDVIVNHLPYDEHLYLEAVDAASLGPDIVAWQGDLVEVGPQGLTLSGGQRQRVAIARAYYAAAHVGTTHLRSDDLACDGVARSSGLRSRLVVLDDPLSCLDSRVAREVAERMVLGLARRGNAVIIATHSDVVLPLASRVIEVNAGQLVWSGTSSEYFERREQRKWDAAFSATDSAGGDGASGADGIRRSSSYGGDASGYTMPRPSSGGSTTPLVAVDEIFESASGASEAQSGEPNHLRFVGRTGPETSTAVQVETQLTKSVTSAVYVEFFKAGGVAFLVFFLLLVATSQGLRSFTDWYLTVWTNGKLPPDARSGGYVGVYGILVGIVCVLGVTRAAVFTRYLARASASLHLAMLRGVLHAPLHFTESTLLGTIMNRFSKDQENLDFVLPMVLFDLMQYTTQAFGALILASVNLPWFAIGAALMLVFPVLLGRKYLAASRQLKRLEGIARSPVTHHFQMSLQGLSTIRAFGLVPKAFHAFTSSLDVLSRVQCSAEATQRWAGIRLDLVASVWIALMACLVIGLRDSIVDVSLAGLLLNLVLTLTGMLQYGTRCFAETETCMTNVERIVEYGCLVSEDEENRRATQKRSADCTDITDAGGKSREPTASALKPYEEPNDDAIPVALTPMPITHQQQQHGALRVDIESLTFAYPTAPDRPCLRNVTLHIRPNQRVGLVGRSGSGKSTLVAMLLRLQPIPLGTVFINGVDIASQPVAACRGSVGVIPQAPTIFEGTFAENVDPFGQFTTDEIVSALRKVHLDPSRWPMGIHTPAGDGTGAGLSMGQKQLLCAARALVRQPKLLLVDESTAYVDHATDAALQRMFRDEARDATVLVVAHRIATIIDFDAVVVMHDGAIVEQGSPRALLELPEGRFRALAVASGIVP